MDKNFTMPHRLLKFFRSEMVDDIAQADCRRYPTRSRDSGQQHSFGNTEAITLLNHCARLKRLWREPDGKRVITEAVADGVEQAHALSNRIGFGADGMFGKINDSLIVAVEKICRLKISLADFRQTIRRKNHVRVPLNNV